MLLLAVGAPAMVVGALHDNQLRLTVPATPSADLKWTVGAVQRLAKAEAPPLSRQAANGSVADH
jgi:hypothetical protein